MNKPPAQRRSYTAVLSKDASTLNMTSTDTNEIDKYLNDSQQSSTPRCTVDIKSKNQSSNFIDDQHIVPKNETAASESPATQPQDHTLPSSLPTEVIDSTGPSFIGSSESRLIKRDPFRKEVCLQATDKRVDTLYMYPFSDILVPEGRRKSFEELVQVFRRNLEDHPRVKSVCNEVTYSLFMCGTSPKEAEAAIVVICEEAILERVQRILTTPAMLEHCGTYTVRSQSCWSLAGIQVRLRRWLFSTTPDTTQFDKPSFPIYFYSGTPRVQLVGSLHQIHSQQAEPSSSASHVQLPQQLQRTHAEDPENEAFDQFHHIPMLTAGEGYFIPSGSTSEVRSVESITSKSVTLLHMLYGAKILNPGTNRSAILSCVIKLGQNWYGLTAAHAFHEAYARKSVAQAGYPIIIKDGNDKGEYNRADEMLLRTIRASGVSCRIMFGSDIGDIESVVWFPQTADFVQLPNGDTITPKNLDWALIPLRRHDLAMASARIAAASSLCRAPVKEIILAHPGHETNILVLSSTRSPQAGTLLVGKTYLSSPDSDMIELWSVELDDDTGLQKGCSGSLVIDATTSRAFGYVVSSDVFGKMQLVPLHQVFEQIHDITAVQPVSLADSTQATVSDRPSASLARLRSSSSTQPTYSPHTQRRREVFSFDLDTPRHMPSISTRQSSISLADIINASDSPTSDAPMTTGISVSTSPGLQPKITSSSTISDESSRMSFPIQKMSAQDSSFGMVGLAGGRLSTHEYVSQHDHKSLLMSLSRARMKLIIRQQPRAARACGLGERDRRVIDPPPILQLCLEDYDPNSASDKSILKSPFNMVSCSLISVGDRSSHQTGQDVSMIVDPNDPSKEIRRLVGQLTISPFITDDLHVNHDVPEDVPKDARIGSYYIFSDLSCRQHGCYKLRFTLLPFDSAVVPIGGWTKTAAVVESDEFTVYGAKDFPGMQQSSELTKKLKHLGASIPIKKGNEGRLKRGTRRRNSNSSDGSGNDT